MEDIVLLGVVIAIVLVIGQDLTVHNLCAHVHMELALRHTLATVKPQVIKVPTAALLYVRVRRAPALRRTHAIVLALGTQAPIVALACVEIVCVELVRIALLALKIVVTLLLVCSTFEYTLKIMFNILWWNGTYPQKCGGTPCGLCGDLFCDQTKSEMCSSCYIDCGPCNATQCISDCSGHGNCDNGQCTCTPPWNGPACSTDGSQPISISVNNTSPNVSISTPQLGNSMFGVFIREISEKNSQNEIVSKFSFQDLVFTMGQSNFGKNTNYSFSATLNNSAQVVVTISQFEETETVIDFANETTIFPPHTLKITFSFYNWPFLALANYLDIVIESQVSKEGNSQDPTCVRDSTQENGGLAWLLVVVDKIALYVKFIPRAVLDGRIRAIQYVLNSDSSITVSLPHFWDHADIDPQFSVLLSDKQATCHNKKHSRVKLKVILPIIFGVLFLAILFVIAFPRIRLWWRVRHSKRLSSTEGAGSNKLDRL
eukprot:Phypoly_transcript_04408.p1 GENE.Phypoly_transcript_04408~~Phypoly_transcript_04408.p1  ORF type:complete len:486 (+),score=51.38 Phypoly_transcript_04408:685-2142(+)